MKLSGIRLSDCPIFTHCTPLQWVCCSGLLSEGETEWRQNPPAVKVRVSEDENE